MFKKVPRTKNYEMSVEGQIRRTDGQECTLTTLNNQPAITLEIYDVVKTVPLEWLRLMTWFEVELPKKYFWNAYFTDIKDWDRVNPLKKTMLFYGARPEYKPGFRIIPDFVRYAISKDSIVIDTWHDKVIPVTKAKKSSYLYVFIWDASRSRFRGVVLHRLVALAWVKNPDHMKYYLVNHKDGNKHNPRADNLEWTNHTGNNKHAFENGLKTQNFRCEVRNFETKEVNVFETVADACKFMGVTRTTMRIFKLHNVKRLINGLYQLRLISDNKEWEEQVDFCIKSQVEVLVKKDNFIMDRFNGFKPFITKYNVSVNKLSAAQIKRAFMRNPKYHGLTVEIINQKINQPIQVYNVASGEACTYDSIQLTSDALNVNPSSIRAALNRHESWVINGYAYRYASNKKWNTNWNYPRNKPMCIRCISPSGEESFYYSAREAEKHTRVNRKAITRALAGVPCTFDWTFNYV